MASLLLNNRLGSPEYSKRVATLVVQRGAVLAPLPVDNVDASSTLYSVVSFGSGHLCVRMPTSYGYDSTPGDLSVRNVSDLRLFKHRSAAITVINCTMSEVSVVPPASENAPAVDAGESVPLTSVDLDLALTFDSYLDFNMRSLLGIKSVLDENNDPVPYGNNSYSLGDLIPGKGVRRTIVTENDFKLVLNVRPTIVKRSIG